MEKNYFGAIEFGALYTLVVIISYHDTQIDVVMMEKSPMKRLFHLLYLQSFKKSMISIKFISMK